MSEPLISSKPLDLARTAKAIEEYDAFDNTFTAEAIGALPMREAEERWKKLAQLGEAVGVAFGLDTADRNSMDTVRSLIRPGPKVPGAGMQVSYVRELVAKWRAGE